jgi:predicted TIM-barrel fold metal-dependent hydrolase
MDRIDVHHHLFPPAFVASLVDNDHYLARGVARRWTPDVSLKDMDAGAIAKAYTSITAPGFALVKDELLFRVNRESNEFGAKMVTDTRGSRFGFFASLPLPDVDATLEEIAYALDTLKADGIGLLTSYRDKWLGDAAFAPVMDELNRRQAVVYVHPTTPDCFRNLMPGIADWVVEFPADTARTLASLLFSNTFARCPHIRFIFAHVGGVLPLVASHFERVVELDANMQKMAPAGALSLLRRQHYDTALRANEVGLHAAVKTVGVPRLLLGTDAPLRESRVQADGLGSYPFTDAERRQIEYENARRLFTGRS